MYTMAQSEPNPFSFSGSRTNAVTIMNETMTANFTINLEMPKAGENRIAVSMIPPTTTLKLIKKHPEIAIASTIFP